ncbi:MAG TPA: EamA family transporter [Nitrososphaeraceae archaeon]|nr:EamA family transporter [Nitrososphaeraceae archaeon]HJY14502.1 EamA family transporter [Nitrososphaeraceae archaeon]
MNQLKLWVVIITLSLTVGSSFIAIKIVLDSIPPLFGFSIRFMITGGILILVSYVFDRKNREIKEIKLWRNALVVGAILIVGGHGLIAWGTQYLSAGIASLLNSMIPLWVVLFMFLMFHSKVTNLARIGLGLGFGGMIILVGPSIGGQGFSLIGVTSLVISSMLWALGSIYSGKSFLAQNFLLSAGMVTLVGGSLLLIPSFLIGEFNLMSSYSYTDLDMLISYLFLIFIGTIIPFAEFYWLLKVSTPPIANTFAYIAPIVAVFFGWAILDESVTYLTIIATVVILLGVALIVRTLNSK